MSETIRVPYPEDAKIIGSTSTTVNGVTTIRAIIARDPLGFVYNDGGRQAAGYKGHAGDCVVRAIAIAGRLSYTTVYNDLHEANTTFAATKRCRTAKKLKARGMSPRDGNFKKVYGQYLAKLGWTWTPTMLIGQGCKVHLAAGELPTGRLIVQLSGHLMAVIDGVMHDTFRDDREGSRCVYGYYHKLGT